MKNRPIRIYSFLGSGPAIFPDTEISSHACIVLLSEASSSSHFSRFEDKAQPREGREARDEAWDAQEFFAAARDGGSYASSPGGNQVDGLPPAPSNSQSSHCFFPEASARRLIMRPETDQSRWGPKLCMARAGFKHVILRIVLSDRDVTMESWSPQQLCVGHLGSFVLATPGFVLLTQEGWLFRVVVLGFNLKCPVQFEMLGFNLKCWISS